MNHTNDNIKIESAVEYISEKYATLTSVCKTDFVNAAKVVTVDKSTIIVKEGQIADKLYFIIDGCCRVFYYKDGKDISDWFAFENDFVSSIKGFKGVTLKF